MKNNLFIPDEQGKELHELKCTTPFLSQAFKWFRDNHKLYHIINPLEVSAADKTGVRYSWFIGSLEDFDYYKEDDSLLGYLTYEEAELECLKELIKIVQNKKVNEFFDKVDSKQSTDDRI